MKNTTYEEGEEKGEEEEKMGDIIISIRKGVDTKELFVGGPRGHNNNKGEGEGDAWEWRGGG